ncbi:MAG: hypothetical protein K0Q79_1282 [Flavipsychrobacter sp.]|jgi:thiol-disulfide isomerase/thioredoxin|nr:hypothetical protein [Flavipsychrobacter sp.]
MKKILLAVSCMAFIANIHAQELPDTEVKDVKTNKKMPFNTTFEQGKVTLVNFWATWCVPCKKEIKNVSLKLAEWQKEAQFNYMTVSVDEARAEGLVRSYAVSQGWTFPYYIDVNSELKRSLNFQSVPYTIIVDKNGKVVFSHTGYEEGGEAEVLAKIKELCAAK